jgi:hypothetical protein
MKLGFFMVNPLQETILSPTRGRSDEIKLSILHHNVQSLGSKLLELNVLLRSCLSKPDILCFSEYWLQKDQILHINIEHYELADSFCRKKDKHEGPCIFVSNVIIWRG